MVKFICREIVCQLLLHISLTCVNIRFVKIAKQFFIGLLFILIFFAVQPVNAEICSGSAPIGTPDLFQVDANATSATLYFTPVSGSSYYFVAFGHMSGDKQYGGEFGTGQEGVQSITVNHLMPNTQYTFVVRGGQGCAPGEWGNEITVMTTGTEGIITSYFKDSPMISGNMSAVQGAMSKSTPTTAGKQTAPDPTVKPDKKATSEAKPTQEAEPTATPKKNCVLGFCF